ncbi:MFS transporter [Oscillospiraceae bacterium MB08-C2-2]|nr:MFS transporter [Oscillospiraceae bacterium MB08-C2-2]
MDNVTQNISNSKWKRNAGFFIGGQFVSMFGSMLVQHAITWHITLKTQSGVWMTLFTCAALLPMVLVSPFAGVWADRYNRKYLVNIADAAIAFITLILAVLFLMGYENMYLMLVVVMVRSFGQGIQQPAVNALIPQTVPPEQLTRFNGIQSSVQSLTMFAAPMLSGVLLSLLPIQYIFFIDVITAVIGISVVFFFVHVHHSYEKKDLDQSMGAYIEEIKVGLRYIGGKPWLKVLMGYTAFFVVFATPAALLTPLQVARTFGDDVWRLAAVEIGFALGMTVGGIAISIWGGFRNKVHTIIMACIAFGLTTVLFGVVPNFWLYLFIMLLCGAAMPMFNTPAMTLMQTNIDPQVMGRVFSVFMMINGLAMPIGMTVFGPLGDVVRIESMLIVTGILLILCGFSLFSFKSLNEVGILQTGQSEAN